MVVKGLEVELYGQSVWHQETEVANGLFPDAPPARQATVERQLGLGLGNALVNVTGQGARASRPSQGPRPDMWCRLHGLDPTSTQRRSLKCPEPAPTCSHVPPLTTNPLQTASEAPQENSRDKRFPPCTAVRSERRPARPRRRVPLARRMLAVARRIGLRKGKLGPFGGAGLGPRSDGARPLWVARSDCQERGQHCRSWVGSRPAVRFFSGRGRGIEE